MHSDLQSLDHVKTLKRKKLWFRLLLVFLFFLSCVTSYFIYPVISSYETSPNSSMLHCDSLHMQHKWESLHLNISRLSHLFLKAGDFFWQEHPSDQALPYGIKGSEQLLLKILSIINQNEPEDIDLECRTCVVVGNGFSIINTSLGGVIDKHDVIIRLNDAPVRGYEEDVGHKTTMRLFYPESASNNPGLNNNPDTLMVMVPFKQQDLLWLKSIVNNEKRVRKGFWKLPPLIWLGDISKLRVLDPYYFHQTADRLLKIPLPSKPGKYRLPVLSRPSELITQHKMGSTVATRRR
ncbi:CMP-N-acetylneuraminate-beta-galactosamide-alpha-2,3-sialyltransferase 4 isoform X2 [Gadus macrocephalus]|uniref:CMP-N-acetylneuraminate-beta-galactosamide- alpha-2,3-sialyltransferase 4 isoform X2 n=1 Tax=Gadus macrocephalus TaxID=80720 RepID=UPI0028CBADEB|nr:CMP-N-acetylneuraminate-beta-galactosamide-alpha-2,3-sialyltransferase 4 isoform X2 [Gadus macrocephalus]XP_059931496.1 CMP-N-acetylneuraminate-beta-galactosamide-alpha-2,3-sialyltransferase 4 isoform X2 [Gadus macrocephalus]